MLLDRAMRGERVDERAIRPDQTKPHLRVANVREQAVMVSKANPSPFFFRLIVYIIYLLLFFFFCHTRL